MSKYNSDSLGYAVLTHNNDYGFDVKKVIETYEPKSYPSVSVIIPYFEIGTIFIHVLRHLYDSLKNFNYEIIVIDDGSVNLRAKQFIDQSEVEGIVLVTSDKNEGRSMCRCKGLYLAKNDICIFMDADMIVDNVLIENTLKVNEYCNTNTARSCITVSFFEFTNVNDKRILQYPLNPHDISLNDFRIHCVYKDTWIGCEEDKVFIDKEFNLVKETNEFKDWKDMVGPWALTNMVLGGFFATDRKSSVNVGGFSNLFEGYGFTETPLPTKLVAVESNYVIPITSGSALHIGGSEVEINQVEKDKIFRKKHDFYFNNYLNLSIENALKDKCT